MSQLQMEAFTYYDSQRYRSKNWLLPMVSIWGRFLAAVHHLSSGPCASLPPDSILSGWIRRVLSVFLSGGKGPGADKETNSDSSDLAPDGSKPSPSFSEEFGVFIEGFGGEVFRPHWLSRKAMAGHSTTFTTASITVVNPPTNAKPQYTFRRRFIC